MLDVIIYEDDEVSIKQYRKAINMLLANNDINYHVYTFKECNDKFIKLINNSNTKKLFIINLDADNNCGINIASFVRENSLENIIILTAKCNKYYNEIFNKRIMAFDYICKCDEYENRLINDIEEALKTIYNDDVFTFKYKNVIYRILFKNINYIEKESNIKRCIIHAIDGEYYIVSSIDKLIESLNAKFIKTHQSCIINTDNIKMLDCVNNQIIFNNDSYTFLLTEKSKKIIKNIIFNNQC